MILENECIDLAIRLRRVKRQFYTTIRRQVPKLVIVSGSLRRKSSSTKSLDIEVAVKASPIGNGIEMRLSRRLLD
jgi:hypothetical protein